MPETDTVQITKSDLALLQNSYKLLNALWDHPEHGAGLKRAAKAVDPSIRVPEIDVAEPLLKPINEKLTAAENANTALAEKLAKLEQDRDDEKEVAKLQKSLDQAQSKYRLTDQGMAEVKKIMAERNIADPIAAAAYVVSEIEPAKPVTGTNFGPTDANILGIDGKAEDDSTKALHQDPLKWMDRAVPEIMREFEQEAA